MKILLTILILIGTIMHLNASAQVLTEQELAVILEDQITAAEQDKLQITKSFNNRGTMATVGDDVSCDFRLGNTRIQDAIDAGHGEIRIAEGNYEENIVIDDIDVQLLGGYANCNEAAGGTYNPNSVSTTIQPVVGSARPAIRVSGDTQRNSLTLRNLTIQRGEDWGFFTAGGVAFLVADYAVSMNKLMITQNDGLLGGGVSVVGGNTDIDMYNVMIGNNDASAQGGGLYCSGADNSIIFDSEDANSAAGIINNRTDGSGGGAYIADGCTFTNYVGTGPGFDFRGMLANEAADHGGAIYAQTGAKVYLYGNNPCSFVFPYTCRGYNTEPVNLTANVADNDNDNTGDGGAVYATGSDTAVYAANMRVNGNSAHYGGAVAVDDGALFQTYTTYYASFLFNNSSCWDNGRCNQYSDNTTTESMGRGGAFYANNGGKLKITRTQIEQNRADYGSAIYLDQANTDLDLEGSYITGNGSATADGYSDFNPIDIRNSSTARIDYTTIADNHVPPTSKSIQNYQASLSIYSSIIHDLSGASALSETSPVVSSEDCLIVNDLGDISGSTNIVDDPEFVDRGNNDYHINAALSPAVDYCDDFYAEYTTQDTDQENRGWDDYTATNNYGLFDVGADETYANDIIFKDGFE